MKNRHNDDNGAYIFLRNHLPSWLLNLTGESVFKTVWEELKSIPQK